MKKRMLNKFLPYIPVLGFALFLTDCDTQPFRQGEILYANFCANCHMADGKGLQGIIPPLEGSDWLRDRQQDLPCIIRYGQKGEIVVNGRTYNQQEMPGVRALSGFEITNVINYINQAWGNDFGYIKYQTVKEALENCPEGQRDQDGG